MTRHFAILLLLAVLVLLQTSAAALAPLWGWTLNLAALGVLLAAFFTPPSKSVWYGLFAGLLLDAFAQSPFGVWAVSLAVLAFAVSGILHSYVRKPVW